VSTLFFREQLKLVFNLNVSVAELSAFIKNFNKDNDHGENINCAAFLVSFFRAGFQERSDRLHELWREKKRVEEAHKLKELQDKKELEMKNSLKVNFQFDEEDKARAILKLRTAARLYDKTTPGAMSMKAFEVKEMQPHVFKEQLKRIFNLNVTPPEMGALMAVFDGTLFLVFCLFLLVDFTDNFCFLTSSYLCLLIYFCSKWRRCNHLRRVHEGFSAHGLCGAREGTEREHREAEGGRGTQTAASGGAVHRSRQQKQPQGVLHLL
jgi:hypothetical protein